MRAFVTDQRRVDSENQDVVRIESNIDTAQILQGAHQKSCTHEDNDRQRDLRHHQCIADAEPFSTGMARTRGASLAFLERRGQIDARAAKSRRDAEKDCGEQRNGDSESEDAQVDTRGESQRTCLIAGHKRNDRVSSPVGKQNPQRAAQHREHYAFRQKLAHHPCAARAQRQSHGHFLLPRGGPGEHQPRHVGASNQQNDADSEHQYVQGIGVLTSGTGQARLRLYQCYVGIIVWLG